MRPPPEDITITIPGRYRWAVDTALVDKAIALEQEIDEYRKRRRLPPKRRLPFLMAAREQEAELLRTLARKIAAP